MVFPKRWKCTKRDSVKMQFTQAQDDDTVILIMGPSGVGKSTFINSLAGKEVAQVGDCYSSRTERTEAFVVQESQVKEFSTQDIPGRLVLVDTPALDASTASAVESLDDIASWLASSYRTKKWKVAGIIYMQAAYPHKMVTSDISDLQVFRAIVGQDCALRTVLVTTRWSLGTSSGREQRENALSAELWGAPTEFGEHGSPRRATMRLDDSSQSAWEVVDELMRQKDNKYPVLHIQREMVDDKTPLNQTTARNALLGTVSSSIGISNGRLNRLPALAKRLLKLTEAPQFRT